ncbi:conserved hypothetical protein [Alkaliphilus metalliredigens QYMF]|uniref:Motility protein n=1 Tax=Alkaliphilus metalliredigens (strain QYMF) TaxID=293826 RepID=A6TL98_ALKMQ|nr:YjfB family protein [Alkaliphilus metalliredigens]ABR46966.1 conserved hypothetical protein [Alkaliphilus metalliredigens QYMF]
MDIAALSMGLNQMKIQQEASISVMKMAMDAGKAPVEELTKMMEQSVSPNVGSNLDIKL